MRDVFLIYLTNIGIDNTGKFRLESQLFVAVVVSGWGATGINNQGQRVLAREGGNNSLSSRSIYPIRSFALRTMDTPGRVRPLSWCERSAFPTRLLNW